MNFLNFFFKELDYNLSIRKKMPSFFLIDNFSWVCHYVTCKQDIEGKNYCSMNKDRIVVILTSKLVSAFWILPTL